MTALEFEQWYASNGGITVQQLRSRDRVVVPCECGDDICQGWASVSRDHMEDYKRMGRIPQDWEWPPK